MAAPKNNKRRPAKFTGSAKITITALSMLGFVGGWNMIARIEASEAQAGEPAMAPLPSAQPVTAQAEALPLPTPWPTIAPLPQLAPIPTLVPTLTAAGEVAVQVQPVANIELAPMQLAPLPTMAPLPPIPEAPPPPPPPPPMPVPAGGWQNSGGS